MGFIANFNWTAGIIAEYILTEFNIHYTVRGATLLLKKLNLSFTRPTYIYLSKCRFSEVGTIP